MKVSAGFNLLELMLAMALSVLILAIMSRSYAVLHAGVVLNRQQLEQNQDLQLSLELIKRDLQNAGVFGSYSFHNQAAGTSYTVSLAALADCNPDHDWCRFESASVGVKSYLAGANLPQQALPAGVKLDPSSDVLRLQYGGTQLAYLNPRPLSRFCRGNNSCLVNQCADDQQFYLGKLSFSNFGIESKARIYFLASANHGYLLSFNTAPLVSENGRLILDLGLTPSSGCLIPGRPYVLVESVEAMADDSAYGSKDPDLSSMQLVNFYTRYYFVATIANIKGLYTETLQADGKLSAPALISARVMQLTMAYKVDSNTAFFNRFPTANNRYSWCSTAAMNGVGVAGASLRVCQAKWDQISLAQITLRGSPSMASRQQPRSLSYSASVGWLW